MKKIGIALLTGIFAFWGTTATAEELVLSASVKAGDSTGGIEAKSIFQKKEKTSLVTVQLKLDMKIVGDHIYVLPKQNSNDQTKSVWIAMSNTGATSGTYITNEGAMTKMIAPIGGNWYIIERNSSGGISAIPADQNILDQLKNSARSAIFDPYITPQFSYSKVGDLDVGMDNLAIEFIPRVAMPSTVPPPTPLNFPGIPFEDLIGKNFYLWDDSAGNQNSFVRTQIVNFTFWNQAKNWWAGSADNIAEIQCTMFAALIQSAGLQAANYLNQYNSVALQDLLANNDHAKGITPKSFLNQYASLKFRQLGLTFYGTYQIPAFPTAELYLSRSSLDVNNDNFVKDYFSIQQKTNSNREIDVNLSPSIAAKALKYLCSSESILSTITSKADGDTKLAGLDSNVFAFPDDRTLTQLGMINPVLENSKTSITNTGISTSAEISLNDKNGEPISPTQNDLVFLASSKNSLTSDSVANISELQPYLWENSLSATPQQVSQISIHFKKQTLIQSLAIWTNLPVASVSQSSPGFSIIVSSKFLKSQQQQTKFVPDLSDTKPATTYFLNLVQLPPKQTYTDLILSFNQPATVLKIGAYSTFEMTSKYSWQYTKDSIQLYSVPGINYFGESQVILRNPIPTISFFQVGYNLSVPVTTPGSGTFFATNFSPIRYGTGGWETPYSYSQKLINNQLMKIGLNKKGLKFPITELDLLKSNKTIGSDGKYSSGSEPSKSDLVPLPNASYYPFAYGLNLPYTSPYLLSSKGPFFMEKQTGVDAFGLINSVMFQVLPNQWNQVFGEYLDSAKARWGNRSGPPAFMNDFFPFSASYYSESALQFLTTPTGKWFTENSSALTDLSKLRPGDILVGNEGSEISAAIVVSIGGQGQSVFSSKDNLYAFMNNVQVVTINKGLQAAILSTWSQFTVDPMKYHARRLLSIPASIQNLVSLPKYPENSVVFSQAKSDPDWYRWIPNTEEIHYLGQMTPEGQGRFATSLPWSIENGDVVDFAFDSTKADQGNIYNNTGKTVFYLVASEQALSETGISVRDQSQSLLEALKKRNDLTVLCKFSTPANTQDGKMNITWIKNDPSYRRSVDLVFENGILEAKVSGHINPSDKFSIVTESPYPGDDIQMGIHLGNSVFKTPRLAVYDKKMLWRANLYINEDAPAYNGSGKDWNDIHRWITNNDWNRVSDGNTDFSALSQLQVGGGGQTVKIADFTPIRGPQLTRNKAVSYDYPYAFGIDPYQDNLRSQDSPFDFNHKMIGQRENLKNFWKAYVSVNNIDVSKISSTGLSYDILRNWSQTVAPNSKWMNYLNNPTGGNLALLKTLGITQIYLPGLGLYLKDMMIPLLGGYVPDWYFDNDQFYLQSPNDGIHDIAGRAVSLPTSNNAAGLADLWGKNTDWVEALITPGSVVKDSNGNVITAELGFVSAKAEDIDEIGRIILNEPNYVRPWTNGVQIMGTGTDCIGFAQQSASYYSNPYKWANLSLGQLENAKYLTADDGSRKYPRYTDGLSYKVANWQDEDSGDLSVLSLAVPGDIMYYRTNHIAILSQIKDSISVNILTNFSLIESTWFTDRNGVAYAEATNNSHTLGDYKYVSSQNPKTWNVVRLRFEK